MLVGAESIAQPIDATGSTLEVQEAVKGSEMVDEVSLSEFASSGRSRSIFCAVLACASANGDEGLETFKIGVRNPPGGRIGVLRPDKGLSIS